MKLFRLQAASQDLLHLDLLRFIASLGIVFHHLGEFFIPTMERSGYRSQTMGLALFVDLFFIISGFVIAYVYHDRVNTGDGYLTFLKRRIARLVPLHWLTMIVSMSVWATFLFLNFHGKHVPSFDPSCIAVTAFFMHSFVPCGNGLFFNGVSWSLSAEMVMYIGFPLIAFLGAKKPRFLFAVWIVSFIAVFLVSFHQWGDFWNVEWTKASAVLRALPSFIFGAMLYYNRQYVKRIHAPSFVLWGVCSALLICMFFGVPQMLLLPMVILLVLLAVASDMNGTVSKNVRTFAPLGQLTYSIYMWHGILILVLMNAFGDKFLHAGPTIMAGLTVLCGTLIFIVSYFSYFFFETPARRWLDRYHLKRPTNLCVKRK